MRRTESGVRSADCEKFRVWKVPSVENKGKRREWKMRSTQRVENEECEKLNP